jgi:hypothetical protein
MWNNNCHVTKYREQDDSEYRIPTGYISWENVEIRDESSERILKSNCGYLPNSKLTLLIANNENDIGLASSIFGIKSLNAKFSGEHKVLWAGYIYLTLVSTDPIIPPEFQVASRRDKNRAEFSKVWS